MKQIQTIPHDFQPLFANSSSRQIVQGFRMFTSLIGKEYNYEDFSI